MAVAFYFVTCLEGLFFFNGVAIAEMLVLTILVCCHGAVCFHKTGGSCGSGGPLDLADFSLDEVTERCHPLRPDHLGLGLCVDNQRDHASLRRRHG